MNADSHALAGAYALDALTEDERAQFERHLAGCPDCQTDIDSLRETVGHLASTVSTPPPAQLRGSVLDAISGVRPLPPLVDDGTQDGDSSPIDEPDEPGDASTKVSDIAAKRRTRTRQLLAAVAAAVVAIGVVVWSPWSQPGREPQQTVAEQVMDANDAETFTAEVDGAVVTIIRSASMEQAVLQTEGMPAAPDGQDYQAWFDDGSGGMTSAGVMPASTDGSSEMLLHGNASDAHGVAISVEPAGGSDQPTSDPIAAIPFE